MTVQNHLLSPMHTAGHIRNGRVSPRSFDIFSLCVQIINGPGVRYSFDLELWCVFEFCPREHYCTEQSSFRIQRITSTTHRGAFNNSDMPPVTLVVNVPGEGFLSGNPAQAAGKVYVHDAPQSLLAVFPIPSETTNELMFELCMKYRHTILQDFPSKCISCKTIPASQLNLPAYGAFDDPSDLRVNAICVHYCHKARCGLRAMQMTHALANHCAEQIEKTHRVRVDSINQCCSQCGKVQDQQKLVCAGCKVTCYCNKACQRKHWLHHKSACKASQEENELVNFVKDCSQLH